jgi:hypothetical protein
MGSRTCGAPAFAERTTTALGALRFLRACGGALATRKRHQPACVRSESRLAGVFIPISVVPVAMRTSFVRRLSLLASRRTLEFNCRRFRRPACTPCCATAHLRRTEMEQPTCQTHGPMLKVPAGTPEQKWCGEWWRCELCTHTVLRPSDNCRKVGAGRTALEGHNAK